MPWFYRKCSRCAGCLRVSCRRCCDQRNNNCMLGPMRGNSSQHRRISCRLKMTLILVLLSVSCISSKHAARARASSTFQRIGVAFVTNDNHDDSTSRKWQQQQRSRESSIISSPSSQMRLSPIRDAERLKRKSISLLLSLSATSSSSSSPSPAEAAAQKSKNSNRQQQCPPSQPLIVSKSKIDSQITQQQPT
jgi:hypothetical protein